MTSTTTESDTNGFSNFNVEEAVQLIKDSELNERTRRSYESCINRFKVWLRDFEDGRYADLLEGDTSNPANFKEGQRHTPKISATIKLDEFAERYEEVLSSFIVYKQTVAKISASSLKGYRAAMTFLFAEAEVVVDPKQEKNISSFFKGVVAKGKQDGGKEVQDGKVPMPYQMYKDLLNLLIIHCEPWMSCYFSLTWNLMCRTVSTEGIKLTHMGWSEDALKIYSPATNCKTDQERKTNPKHVYANPMSPNECPILLLATHLLCSGNQTPRLFPGVSVSARFTQAFSKFLNRPDVREVLNSFGKTSGIGIYSLREGAASFVTSGSTMGPSAVSVSLRSSRAIGGMQNKYLRYDSAGDQFTGRTVAGLPYDCADFAALPPHFSRSMASMTAQTSTLNICFPKLVTRGNLNGVLRMCLASLVYHRNWIREHFPLSHPVLHHYLFTSGKVDTLAAHIITGRTSPVMASTGVPPITRQMEKLDDIISTVGSLQQSICSGIRSTLDELLTKHGQKSGDVTSANMQELMDKMLQSFNEKVDSCISAAQKTSPPSITVQEVVHNNNSDDSLVHSYDGKYWIVPKDWSIPSVNTRVGWFLWWCGDKTKRIMPLRKFWNGGYPKKLSKPLAEWRFLFNSFEEHLRDKNLLPNSDQPTEDEVNEMYDACSELMDKICANTRKRERQHTFKVLTVAKRLRQDTLH